MSKWPEKKVKFVTPSGRELIVEMSANYPDVIQVTEEDYDMASGEIAWLAEINLPPEATT